MIVIFYLRQDGSPDTYEYADTNFPQAVTMMETLRKQGMTHVCMSTAFENQVGKPGVASVENGLTPDGQIYDWSKQHRGAGPTK